jgi:hypothetical protein
MGWDAKEIPGLSCRDVVAFQSCSGFSVQVCVFYYQASTFPSIFLNDLFG